MNINFETLITRLDPQLFFGGDSAVFWGPLSWTIIWGLTFATFVTLIFVPVLYYATHRLNNRILRYLGIKKEEFEEELEEMPELEGGADVTGPDAGHHGNGHDNAGETSPQEEDRDPLGV